MATIELTRDNFEQVVNNNDIVIIDFWASWCGPCRTFAPTFEAASENHDDIVFGKIDTEAQQEIAGFFKIQSIPTLMVFREKVGVFSKSGALPAHMLDELIKQIRDLNMDDVRAKIEEGQDETEN